MLFIISMLSLFSCGGSKEKVKMYELKQEALTSFVNPQNLSGTPNPGTERFIVNNDYPIELALYSDKRFYYNLPNLGDGDGTWNYDNGKIVMKAKRSILGMDVDMVIEMKAADSNGESLAIHFMDRHGPNTMKMMNVNFEL